MATGKGTLDRGGVMREVHRFILVVGERHIPSLRLGRLLQPEPSSGVSMQIKRSPTEV